MADTTYETVLYTEITPEIARISMNRPEARNAQNMQLTYDLNAAFDRAAQSDEVKVIILSGEGPHFSAGHDMKGSGKPLGEFTPVGTWGSFDKPGAEGAMAREEEIYIQMCHRWRNIPKPVIAEVQGKTIAGGLMLAWISDIIIAADNAEFRDLVVGWGIPGVEYFAHPWELGHRKAREMLYTADWVSAEDAHRLGMVNHVVPLAELRQFSEAMARRIAEKPSFENHQAPQLRRDANLLGLEQREMPAQRPSPDPALVLQQSAGLQAEELIRPAAGQVAFDRNREARLASSRDRKTETTVGNLTKYRLQYQPAEPNAEWQPGCELPQLLVE